jgi:hypothetical protein
LNAESRPARRPPATSSALTVPNLAARLVRAIDGVYDGDHALVLSILEDVVHEMYELDRCDVCGAELDYAEALDARVARRHNLSGICRLCTHEHSARAA